MHAVVVSVTVNDLEAARGELEQRVVPMVSGAPGFVAAYWVAVGDNKGRSIAVFESEEAARAMAEQVQDTERGAVVIDSVETGAVVASA